MKSCDLCGEASATMYCESDAARLCVICDEKVHGANFLVAKHERSLLCSVCQSVTSWKASGPRLGRTVSVCEGCVCDRDEDLKEEMEVESRDRSDEDEEPDGSSDEDEEEEEVEDEDEENQVVPWSSGDEASWSTVNGGGGRELKRRREVTDLNHDDVGEGGGDWDHESQLVGLNLKRFPNRNVRETRPTSSRNR